MFSSFVMGLASATLIELGMMEDPITKKKRHQPQLAQQHVEILQMLEQKTRGNLTEDERQLLEKVLRDVKLAFAKAATQNKS
ncbi:MAG: DUF1844 domain-containing protein [Bdellovibrionales bacterium]|nr:DUF1844 domain-containing protein [Bdellovibrionales bacterium]